MKRGHVGRCMCSCDSYCPDPDPFVVIYGEDAPDQGLLIKNPLPQGPFWKEK